MSSGTSTFLTELTRALLFRGGHNTGVVVIGATLLGVAAGVLGVFTLLRKRALLTDALSHATLPGVAGAFLIATALGLGGDNGGKSLPILLCGAAVAAVVALGAVQALLAHGRLKDDAVIAVVLSVAFGLGVVLLSVAQNSASGQQGGLTKFIYGQTAAMRPGDARLIGGVCVVALLACAGLFKELRLLCFDDRFAVSVGRPTWLLDTALMTLVVLVTVVGLQAVGLLLIVALLIIPPAAARFWTERLGRMAVLSGAMGGLAGYLGASLSAAAPRLPTGGVIVLAAGGVFAVSMLGAPSRGIIASALRLARLRLRIALDHVLRSMYEALEEQAEKGGAHAGNGEREPKPGMPLPDEALHAEDEHEPVSRRLARVWLRVSGVLVAAPGEEGGLTLSEQGFRRARAITARHRLWERYLVSRADVPASHVDRSADFIEHALTPEEERELRRELGSIDLSKPGQMHPSVHPLGKTETTTRRTGEQREP